MKSREVFTLLRNSMGPSDIIHHDPDNPIYENRFTEVVLHDEVPVFVQNVETVLRDRDEEQMVAVMSMLISLNPQQGILDRLTIDRVISQILLRNIFRDLVELLVVPTLKESTKIAVCQSIDKLLFMGFKNNPFLMEGRLEKGNMLERLISSLKVNLPFVSSENSEVIQLAIIDLIMNIAENSSTKPLVKMIKDGEVTDLFGHILGIIKELLEKKKSQQTMKIARGIFYTIQCLLEEPEIAEIMIKSRIYVKASKLLDFQTQDEMIVNDLMGICLGFMEFLKEGLLEHSNEQFTAIALQVMALNSKIAKKRLRFHYTEDLQDIFKEPPIPQYKKDSADDITEETSKEDIREEEEQDKELNIDGKEKDSIMTQEDKINPFAKKNQPIKLKPRHSKELRRVLRTWEIKMTDQLTIAVNLARFFEIVYYLGSPFEPIRESYIDPELIFGVLSQINLGEKILNCLSNMDRVQEGTSELFENTCQCFLSFIINYFIYLYQNDILKIHASDFDFQILQVLVIELRNYLGYLYINVYGKENRIRLFSINLLKKILEVTDLILENQSDDTIFEMLQLCGIIDWIRMFQILDEVYGPQFTIKREFLRILSKISKPEIYNISGCEIEDECIDQLCILLVKVVRKSESLMEVAEGVNCIMDIFKDNTYSAFEVKHKLYRILYEGKDLFSQHVKSHLPNLSKEDREFASVVLSELGPYLEYKSQNFNNPN